MGRQQKPLCQVGPQTRRLGPWGERPPHLPLWCLPFIICELVSVVVGGDDVHEENVLCFGIQASHLHFVTGKHPPERGRRKNPGRE